MASSAVSKLASRTVPLISRRICATTLTGHGLKLSGGGCVGSAYLKRTAFTGCKLGAGGLVSFRLFSPAGVRHFGFAVSCSAVEKLHVEEEAEASPPAPAAAPEEADAIAAAEQGTRPNGVELLSSHDTLAISEPSPDANSGGKFGEHPWPEWTALLSQMHGQGYFDIDTVRRQRDITALKMAFRNLGQQRDDIYSNLPRSELELLAGAGCPNVQRKVVSSAKRLRHELGIKEFLVCDECTLRVGCKRAYQDAASESEVSTANVLRLLLQYGLNAWDEESSVPPKAKTATVSLLRDVMRLNAVPRDPSLPPPRARVEQLEERQGEGAGFGWMLGKSKPEGRAERRGRQTRGEERSSPAAASQPYGRSNSRMGSVGSPAMEMKPGDWICNECNYSNFARNEKCRGCEADAPAKTWQRQTSPRSSSDSYPSRGGRERSVVREGRTPPSDGASFELKPGDWVCSECSYANYARNTTCRRCSASAPVGNKGRQRTFQSSNDSYGRSTRERARDDKPRERRSAYGSVFHDDLPADYSLIPFGDRDLSHEEVAFLHDKGDSLRQRYDEFKPDWGKVPDDDGTEDVDDSDLPAASAYGRDWDDKPLRSVGGRERGWDNERFQQPTPIGRQDFGGRNGGNGRRNREDGRLLHDEFKPDWGKGPGQGNADDDADDDLPAAGQRDDVGGEEREERGERRQNRFGASDMEGRRRSTSAQQWSPPRNNYGLGDSRGSRDAPAGRQNGAQSASASGGAKPRGSEYKRGEDERFSMQRGWDTESTPKQFGERPSYDGRTGGDRNRSGSVERQSFRSPSTRGSSWEGESGAKRYGDWPAGRGQGQDDDGYAQDRSSSSYHGERQSFRAPNARGTSWNREGAPKRSGERPARNFDQDRSSSSVERRSFSASNTRSGSGMSERENKYVGGGDEWGTAAEGEANMDSVGGGRFLPQRQGRSYPRKSYSSGNEPTPVRSDDDY